MQVYLMNLWDREYFARPHEGLEPGLGTWKVIVNQADTVES